MTLPFSAWLPKAPPCKRFPKNSTAPPWPCSYVHGFCPDLKTPIARDGWTMAITTRRRPSPRWLLNMAEDGPKKIVRCCKRDHQSSGCSNRLHRQHSIGFTDKHTPRHRTAQGKTATIRADAREKDRVDRYICPVCQALNSRPFPCDLNALSSTYQADLKRGEI